MTNRVHQIHESLLNKISSIEEGIKKNHDILEYDLVLNSEIKNLYTLLDKLNVVADEVEALINRVEFKKVEDGKFPLGVVLAIKSVQDGSVKLAYADEAKFLWKNVGIQWRSYLTGRAIATPFEWNYIA